jgi:single-strand DNA-binding protein
MQHINVSLVGVVVSEVFSKQDESQEFASFRMVCRPRRFDATLGQTVECEPSFVTVMARRSLAGHVVASVGRGDPVIVMGRLRVREREVDGHTRVRVEIDAQSVGHDLGRGTTTFTRRSSRPRLESRSDHEMEQPERRNSGVMSHTA